MPGREDVGGGEEEAREGEDQVWGWRGRGRGRGRGRWCGCWAGATLVRYSDSAGGMRGDSAAHVSARVSCR